MHNTAVNDAGTRKLHGIDAMKFGCCKNVCPHGPNRLSVKTVLRDAVSLAVPHHQELFAPP